MDNNYCVDKESILTTFEDKIKEQFSNSQKSLEKFEDLFIEVGNISCITGPRLVLNDKYRGK